MSRRVASEVFPTRSSRVLFREIRETPARISSLILHGGRFVAQSSPPIYSPRPTETSVSCVVVLSQCRNTIENIRTGNFVAPLRYHGFIYILRAAFREGI